MKRSASIFAITALTLLSLVLFTNVSAQPTTPQALYPLALGTIACADKVSVTISESKKTKGHYDIQIGKQHFDAVRVATESGAIRLENKATGIVWLEMANKSMLFNEKAGKRLANDCRNDAQMAAEKAMATSTAPTVLDTPEAKKP